MVSPNRRRRATSSELAPVHKAPAAMEAQIIVDQGVGVDEFDCAGGVKRGCDIAGEDARRLETEDRADSLSTGEDAVTHCRMNGRGRRGFGREEPRESGIDCHAVFFEKWGKFHCGRELARRLPSRITLRSPAPYLTPQHHTCPHPSYRGCP